MTPPPSSKSSPPPDAPSCAPLAVHCKHDAIVALAAHPPHPKNDNVHTPEQIALFVKILKRQGIRRAAVVSKESGHFVTGHGLREALQSIGVTGIPVDYQSFASEKEELAHLMADNQLGKLAIRNDELTEANLQELNGDEFDLTLAGFTDAQLEDFDLGGAPDDFDDGFEDNRGGKGGDDELGDTQIQFGEYRIPVTRADYLAWQEEIRREVGFKKAAILREIKKRIGL